MTAIARGDLVVGDGALGWSEIVSKLAAFAQYLQTYDDAHLDNAGGGEDVQDHPMLDAGITFSPSGHLYISCDDPKAQSDYAPHDIVWLPRAHEGAQLAVLIARIDSTLEIWEYNQNLDNPIQKHTGLDVDVGWDHTRYTHLDCLCDGRTILYTTQGKTIFRYHLDDGQLPPLTALGSEAHHIYAALKVLKPSERILVAMTSTGHGPRNAICLDSNGTSLWHDEINPPDSIYHIWKRLIVDGSLINDVSQGVPEGKFTVSLKPGVAGVGNNAEVWSLACWLRNLCAAPGGQILMFN